MASADSPCSCWTARPYFHEGHCCIAGAALVGPAACPHEDEGRVLAAQAAASRPPDPSWPSLDDYYPPPPRRA